MDPERWHQVQEILDAALARRKDERAAFLVQACAGDDALRQEVQSLLAQTDAAHGFLEAPPVITPSVPTDEAPTGTPLPPLAWRTQAEARALAPGQVFGSYRIERLLGRGGMGEVYVADERETGRRVALKVLRRAMLTEVDRARFLREGRLAASVSHPHVVYVFGSAEIEGMPIITMELIPGGTLNDQGQRRGPLPPVEAVDAILQVIAGLDAAATAGVLHRDIKPSNCFVDSQGHVKVGDFGLSISTSAREETQVTTTGALLGTPAFAAPEQLRGDELDVRSDIYAVGATLFYLLTGRAPIEETNLLRLVARIAHEAPPSPRGLQPLVSQALEAVVLRCLAKQPGKRFANYAALVSVLEPLGSVRPIPATPGKRVVAAALDWLLLSVATSILGNLLPKLVGQTQGFLFFRILVPLVIVTYFRSVRSQLGSVAWEDALRIAPG